MSNATKEKDADDRTSMFAALETGVSDDEEEFMGIDKDVGKEDLRTWLEVENIGEVQEAMLSDIADKFEKLNIVEPVNNEYV